MRLATWLSQTHQWYHGGKNKTLALISTATNFKQWRCPSRPLTSRRPSCQKDPGDLPAKRTQETFLPKDPGDSWRPSCQKDPGDLPAKRTQETFLPKDPEDSWRPSCQKDPGDLPAKRTQETFLPKDPEDSWRPSCQRTLKTPGDLPAKGPRRPCNQGPAWKASSFITLTTFNQGIRFCAHHRFFHQQSIQMVSLVYSASGPTGQLGRSAGTLNCHNMLKSR